MSPADPEHPDKTSEHRPALDADAGARPATVSRQGYGNADYHVSHSCVHRPSDLVAALGRRSTYPHLVDILVVLP